MPAAFRIDVERRLVLTRAWGVLTGQELLVHSRTLRADPSFSNTFSQLADFRDVTSLEVKGDAIRALAAENNFGPGARRAFVVSSDVIFGMARMYESLTDDAPSQLRTFREFPLAIEWMGLQHDAAHIAQALATIA